MRLPGPGRKGMDHEVCEKISFSRTADAVFRHFIDVQAPFPLLEDLDIDIRFANFNFQK